MTATTGCQTCGGYGDKHDLGAHFDSGEDVRVTYAEGGYLPKMTRCLLHPDHPTPTSDCATEEPTK